MSTVPTPDEQFPVLSEEKPKKHPVRTAILIVMGFAIMIGIFALLFPQMASYADAWNQLTHLGPGWIALLVAACLLNIIVYPYTVLVAVPGLGYRHGFIERQGGFLVSNVVPGGGAVAVGTQYAILARYGTAPAVAAAAVSADAVWTYLLTLGFPALAVVLLTLEGRSTAAFITVAIVGIVVVVVSILAIIVILRSDAGATRVGRIAEKIVHPIFRRFKKTPPDLVKALVEFRFHAADLVKSKWIMLTVTNMAAQLTPLVIMVCAMWAIGIFPAPISPVEAFAAYAIALILTSFPITPGGLGTVDAALVGLLVAFGADSTQAVAVDLMWRLVWFLPQLIVGAIAMGMYALEKKKPLKVKPGDPATPTSTA